MNGPQIKGPQINESIMNGPPPPNMPPSPPHSNARSSNGSRLMSMSSQAGSDRKKYSMQVLESELQEHHRVLRAFLDQSLREDRGYHPHNRARDKLLRLSAIQFQELSTDVYDELLRREEERSAIAAGEVNKIPRALVSKQNFHPKRNQARQKLSTLASRKFRELATDVLFELERRVPRLAGASIDRGANASPTGSTTSYTQRGPAMRSTRGPHGMSVSIPSQQYQGRRPSASSNPPYSPAIFEGDPNTPALDYGRPTAKQFQSNTMVPNKSTMVEDDDDASDGASAYDVDQRHLSRRTTGMSGVGRLRDSHFGSEQQGQITQLQQKVRELEEQLKQKDEELTTAQANASHGVEAEQAKSSSVLSDLERQIQTAEDLNTSLKQEVDRLRDANASLESRMQDHAAASGDLEDLRARNIDLENASLNHENLRAEYESFRRRHEVLQGEHQGVRQQYEALQENSRGVDEEHGELLDNHRALQEEHSSVQNAHRDIQRDHETLKLSHQDLQEEHNNLESDHADLSGNFERMLSEHTTLKQQQQNNDNDASNIWQTKHEELEKRFNDREQAVQQTRQESVQMLQELSMLSDQHDQGENEKEKLQERIAQLQNELEEWKHRYARTKTAQRSLKATSMNFDADRPDATEALQNSSFNSPTGMVKDIHVTNFQTAIGELLQLTRSEDHAAAFNYMRSVVSTVSAVVKDVETSPASASEDVAKQIGRLKKQLSKATNNLITTSKVFAASDGLAPFLLVDAAASDLTAAVIALLKVVKISPTPRGELLNGDESRFIPSGTVRSRARRDHFANAADA